MTRKTEVNHKQEDTGLALRTSDRQEAEAAHRGAP